MPDALEDGFVHLRGRAKDLIIRGGHNIDPTVIEDALLAHPQVTGAAAVGRPDPHSGEVPVAFVTLAPGAHATEQDLCAWAAMHVAERAAAPKHVSILAALPVTDVGKPYKLALRAQAAQSELADALAELRGVRVTVRVEDGSITADIVIGSPAEQSAVKSVLSRYAITWRAVPEP